MGRHPRCRNVRRLRPADRQYPTHTLEAWYSTIQPISEDCLFLNVFTTAVGQGRRPVMVWLHGGGWTSCAGTAPGFDGTNLARDGDVVVVTINHRLNVFGYHPTSFVHA
jgi:para-nitrobenzyl esterase